MTGKRLAKAGLLTGKIITGILSTRIEFTTNHQESIEVGLFVPLEGAKQAEAAFKQQSLLAKQLNANEQYRKAVRTDNQYAYFLKGIKEDTGDKLSIVVVEKTTGKELHTRYVVPEAHSLSVCFRAEICRKSLWPESAGITRVF